MALRIQNEESTQIKQQIYNYFWDNDDQYFAKMLMTYNLYVKPMKKIGYTNLLTNQIVVNSTMDVETMAFIVKHELLHHQLRHKELLMDALKQSYEKEYLSMFEDDSVKELIESAADIAYNADTVAYAANIAGDSHLSRVYTEREKELAKKVIAVLSNDGKGVEQTIQGIVLELDHPEWINYTYEELFWAAYKEIAQKIKEAQQQQQQQQQQDEQDQYETEEDEDSDESQQSGSNGGQQSGQGERNSDQQGSESEDEQGQGESNGNQEDGQDGSTGEDERGSEQGQGEDQGNSDCGQEGNSKNGSGQDQDNGQGDLDGEQNGGENTEGDGKTLDKLTDYDDTEESQENGNNDGRDTEGQPDGQQNGGEQSRQQSGGGNKSENGQSENQNDEDMYKIVHGRMNSSGTIFTRSDGSIVRH